MAQGEPLVAVRLRRAIESTADGDIDGSIRALSKILADRPDVKAKRENVRRSLQKFLAGGPIGTYWQLILEAQLGLPSGYLYTENATAIKQRELEIRLSQLEERRYLEDVLGDVLTQLDEGVADPQKFATLMVDLHAASERFARVVALLAARAEHLGQP